MKLLRVATLKFLFDLGRLSGRSESPDTSFAGEYAHLGMLVNLLGIESGFVVDIAASDGVTQSSTLGFFKKPGWSGLAVEMDPANFAKLSFVYSQFKSVRLARGRVTPFNVAALLRSFEVPVEFALLNLDIDSYDLSVIQEILEQGFRPTIISMEVNEKIPPPIYFSVEFDENHYWQGDHFFGCSLSAASEKVKRHGYILESMQYNNAIFVRSDLATGKLDDSECGAAYDLGYRSRDVRKTLFPWNADMEPLLQLSPERSVEFLNDHFKMYAGSYNLHICDSTSS